MDWKGIQFDWNHARAFLVVANEGSFSAAARALGMTQPTLGRQISALETQLQVTLFERLGNGLVLTQAGKALLEEVGHMGLAAQRFSLLASGQQQSLSGEVCVSVGEFDGFFFMPQIAKQLAEQAPGIKFKVTVTNDISDLKRREADIAIRNVRPKSPDMFVKRLMQERIHIYGQREYLRRFEPFDPKAPGDLSIIDIDGAEQVRQYFAEQGWQLQPHHFGVSSRSLLLHWQLIQQGLGVGFLPEHLEPLSPHIERAFSGHYQPLEFPIWLVSHRELLTSPRVRFVFDTLAQFYAQFDD